MMMVLPFRRAEIGAAATYTLYGKLPNRADFVRVNADHVAVTELDSLIQRSFERLTCQENWERYYDAGIPVEFQYVSEDQRHIILGVLSPSRDQAGRRYPLIAGAILPSESIMGYAHVAPIAYEVFFDGLREHVASAVENSVEALSCRQFLESQLRANDTAAADLELALGVVDRYLRNTSVSVLSGILDADVNTSGLQQALLNLAFYRAFLRRFDNRSTHQVIQLPLPAGQGERALLACAWLSILDALWRGSHTSAPWCGNYLVLEASDRRPMLAAAFGRAQERFTSIMLGNAPDATSCLELSQEQLAWTSHSRYAEVSYALGRLLAEPGLSLHALCEFLKDVSRKLEDGI